MILKDDFFSIAEEIRGEDKAATYKLSLNSLHPIYKAHFPGNPITPGVCIIQICKELFEHFTGERFALRKLINVKFLSVINPDENAEIYVDLIKYERVGEERQGYKLTALVRSDETQFAKLVLELAFADGRTVYGDEMQRMQMCVVIPTYNNRDFIGETIESVLHYAQPVIVVNDGSTDGTETVLEQYRDRIEIINYQPNKGKARALCKGFDRAVELGCRYAITLDSDGQHSATDIAQFIDLARERPDCLIVGARNLREDNMPAGNTFANRFSNFWFAVQTGIRLPDTQSGFRLYPLARMKRLRAISSRYEGELEMLVRAAWRNIPILTVPVGVKYPTGRITHFRPTKDFLRISLLNTALCFAAIFYGYPAMLVRKLLRK